jgi:hypothetical protein
VRKECRESLVEWVTLQTPVVLVLFEYEMDKVIYFIPCASEEGRFASVF